MPTARSPTPEKAPAFELRLPAPFSLFFWSVPSAQANPLQVPPVLVLEGVAADVDALAVMLARVGLEAEHL